MFVRINAALASDLARRCLCLQGPYLTRRLWGSKKALVKGRCKHIRLRAMADVA